MAEREPAASQLWSIVRSLGTGLGPPGIVEWIEEVGGRFGHLGVECGGFVGHLAAMIR